MNTNDTYTAFDGNKQLFTGTLASVILKVKKHLGKDDNSTTLIFSDSTGKTIDFNFQGNEQDVQKRLEIFITEDISRNNAGPGRPKLGVISREVSLLPRHWEWLATQTGGASATLRRLVEEAKKKSISGNQVKLAQERTYKFLSTIAGDYIGYEEALRALYKCDKKIFVLNMQSWPADVRNFALLMATSVFEKK
jgi:hypothetical protein